MSEDSVTEKNHAPRQSRRGCAWLMFVLMVVVSAVWGACLGAFVLVLENTQTQLEALEDFRPKIGSRVYSDDGELLGAFTTEEVRQAVSLREMPLHLQKAFIATEDDRFYHHKGVRPLSILNAVLYMVRTGRVRGASTITQQLVRNIEATGVSREQTFQRKLREALFALQLEREFTKDEILELYLNQIFLGVSAHGVEAAAHQYFNKRCRELTLSESAMLAGLTRSPNRNEPFRHIHNARDRRNVVLEQMLNNAFITETEYRQALNESLEDSVVTPEERAERQAKGEDLWQPNRFKAPYFAEEVRRFVLSPPSPHEVEADKDEIFEEGLTIYTTIDMRLQRAAEQALFQALEDFDEKKLAWLKRVGREDEFVPVTGALVCLDNRPGREGFVRAMVGGRDFQQKKFNNATQARRQPGSSFKPFVWMAGFDRGMTASDVMLDEEIVRIDGAGKEWRPQNFTGEFRGPRSLRNALENSVNIISVKLVERLGMKNIRTYMQRAGITSPLPEEVGLTLGLGTPEVLPIELCNAFSTLAKGGIRSEPIMVTDIKDRDGNTRYDYRNFTSKTRVFEPDLVYNITYVMQGVCQFGSGRSSSRFDRPRAGKTGTTNMNTNAWFTGYTPQYTAIVWVGYEDNRSLGEKEQGVPVTGGTLAAPIWTDFMIEAHEDLPVQDFSVPSGVRFYYVDHHTGVLGGRFPEAFIRGATPPREFKEYKVDDEVEQQMNEEAILDLDLTGAITQ